MGGVTFTKLMLNSTQVEVEVEVGVELGKKMIMKRSRVVVIHSTVVLQ